MRVSFALGVLVLVDVLDSIELVSISGSTGLLDLGVIDADGFHPVLTDAVLEVLVERHFDAAHLVHHPLLLLFVLHTEEAESVNAENLGKSRGSILDELIRRQREEVFAFDVEAVLPAVLICRDIERADAGLHRAVSRVEQSVHEHHRVGELADGGVRSGVRPHAGRNDFDLDSGGGDFLERLIEAHSFWFHDTYQCINQITHDSVGVSV
jgi:hypothetical protein